jgi:hypothetical protein
MVLRLQTYRLTRSEFNSEWFSATGAKMIIDIAKVIGEETNAVKCRQNGKITDFC